MDAAMKNTRSEELAARGEELAAQLGRARREAARLNAQLDDLFALMDRYGADQWRRGNEGRAPQGFVEWRKGMGA